MLNVSMDMGYTPMYSSFTKQPFARNSSSTPFESLTQQTSQGEKLKDVLKPKGECQTCKNRKYQDESDDSGVSFQTPTHVAPSSAGSAVVSHELEHVYRERLKADGESARVVSQSVMIHTSICPECHRTYVSGGTTTTKTSRPVDSMFNVGKEEKKPQFAMAV